MAVKTQDYMPEDDFDPSQPIPMPEPMPGDLNTAESFDLQNATDALGGQDATGAMMDPAATMPSADEPEAFDNSIEESAESPSAPSVPSSLPTGSYALPGSLGSRPYRSANLKNPNADFADTQGFGGGGDMGSEDEDLINGIARSLRR